MFRVVEQEIVLIVELLEKTTFDFLRLSFWPKDVQNLFRVPRMPLHEWVMIVENSKEEFIQGLENAIA